MAARVSRPPRLWLLAWLLACPGHLVYGCSPVPATSSMAARALQLSCACHHLVYSHSLCYAFAYTLESYEGFDPANP
ncbi:uncharacterized [Tachysurus ichikawai]